MLGTERQQYGVVGGRRLELEIERHAELLSQPQSERPVDPGPERRVDDELHPPGLVEEPLEHDVVVGGQHAAERRPAGPQIVDDQGGGHDFDTRSVPHEVNGRLPPVEVEAFRHRAPEPGYLLGELVGAARGLAQPERDRGVLAGRIPHAHHAVGHLHDLPGMGAEQEHVALLGFDGEVLVHGADENVARLHQHPEIPGLGNRAAGGEGGQPGAPAAAEPPVHPVAMEVCHAPAAPGLDADRDQLDDLLELVPRESPVWPGPRQQAEQLVLGHTLVAPGRRLGHDLLGEDVERLLGRTQRIQAPLPDRGQQRGAFNQVVPGGRVHDAAGDTHALVVRPAHPLKERRDAVRRANLAHQLDRPDVDAQLQRGGGHQGSQLTGPQAMLDPLPPLARERSVMGGHLVLAEPLAELMGHPLGQHSGVDEDQRGSVAGDVGGDAVEDLAELVAGDGGFQLAVGQLERQVEAASVPAVDDGRHRLGRSHQQAGRRLDRFHGGREADADGGAFGHGLEPLQREGEVRAPLVPGQGMDLVHDDRLHGGEGGPGALGGEVQVQGFGRGDQEVRGPADHHLPLP